MFTHIEDASASIVIQNALFLGRKRLSDLAIPGVPTPIRKSPMSACTCGKRGGEHTCRNLHHPHERHSPAIADGEEDGFVKISVKAGTDKILGATVVARHAGEMINDISLAITRGIGLSALSSVTHPYPTQAQAIKMAADAHKRASVPWFRKWLSRQWLARW